MYFKQHERLDRREQLLFAKGVIRVLPNRPFHTLIVNRSNEEINMPQYICSLVNQVNPYAPYSTPRVPVSNWYYIINENSAPLIPSRSTRVKAILKKKGR